jgi:predicted phosphoribosyltransferase
MKYESRLKAGKILFGYLKNKNENLYNQITQSPNDYFCYAIPNGGVPVSEGFCAQLNIFYDILIVRKIKIPYNTEAGFGAVTTDGTVLFNEPLLNQLNLSKTQIDNSIQLTKDEIQERIKFYSREIDLQEYYAKNIKNKIIFLLDDGLASGFTALAGIKMIKKYDPRKIYIIVPTAPLRTVQRIRNEVNEIYCPNIRNTSWFAVADAYQHWYDVPENEVLEIINKSKYYIVNI